MMKIKLHVQNDFNKDYYVYYHKYQLENNQHPSLKIVWNEGWKHVLLKEEGCIPTLSGPIIEMNLKCSPL
jgi:hypothetical protein